MVGMTLPSGTQIASARGGGLRVTGKQHETVKGRFLRAHLKQEWSPTRQRMEYVERTFDKVTGTYDETYYDPETGGVVFEKHAPISDQSVHGRRR